MFNWPNVRDRFKAREEHIELFGLDKPKPEPEEERIYRMEYYPLWGKDPHTEKPRLYKTEDEHKRHNPKEHAELAKDRARTSAALAESMADADYRRGLNDGIAEQREKDARLAETFPKSGRFGREIAAAIRAQFVPEAEEPKPPEEEAEAPLATAASAPESTAPPSDQVDPALQPKWGDE